MQNRLAPPVLLTLVAFELLIQRTPLALQRQLEAMRQTGKCRQRLANRWHAQTYGIRQRQRR